MSEESGTGISSGTEASGTGTDSTDTSGTDSDDTDTDGTDTSGTDSDDTDTDGTDTEGAESGICGDGVLQEDEECDDANAVDTDACLSTCANASCGDGFVFDGQEECDNAQSNSDSAVCTASCVAAVCGDGLVLQWEEECDNAGLNSDDAMCTANCAAAVCGDGLVWLGTEDCDAGMANGPGNACTDECLANVCGDGVLGPGEGCDDGNGIDGDECTNACAPATCGDAILAQGESCDDGNAVDTDVCLSTCAMASCGDGFVFGGHEECDNAEFNSDNAMCTAGCVAAVCGDGLVWLGSEACDDANMAEFDLCTTQCFEQAPPELQLSFSQVKEFDFSWAPVFGAAYYQLWESRDGNQNFSQVGGNIVGESFTLAVPLHFRVNSSYKLLACNEEGCLESEIVDVVGTLASAVGYFKASNTGANDLFGYSVALSEDGTTLAVGAHGEASGAMVVNGNQADNSAPAAGAVYVFRRIGGNWTQQAYLKASNAGSNDAFGWSVALSGDGNTLAVGAHQEDSNATGINDLVGQASNSTADAGAVYVFVRNGEAWSQQAYVKASNTGAGDLFGVSVALTPEGNTLAVGAHLEDSNAKGINDLVGQANNSTADAGAVYVFVRNSGVWSQQAYVKASNTDAGSDSFGWSVALSGDGSTLAVGAYEEASNATGINGNQANNSATQAGAVYVFVRNEEEDWLQQAYIKASNTNIYDFFGTSVALSGDGSTLAVGAPEEDSGATGIGGNQFDNSVNSAGAVYVFVRNEEEDWLQQAYIKASNTGVIDYFGRSVALSEEGNTLAVGANREDSSARGVDDEADTFASDSGAAYVFVRNEGGDWTQQAYVKASNTTVSDIFGWSVALSGDGNTLAAGAYRECSNATGISGNQANNSANNAGAVYLY